MSNPTVSFRISDYHLARGLRAIRTIEPNWKMTTTSELIRTIFQDYIAKSEFKHNSPLDVTPELLQEIAMARLGVKQEQSSQPDIFPMLGTGKQPQQLQQRPAWQIQQDIENEKILQELKRESAAKMQQEQQEKKAQQAERDLEIDKQIALAQQSFKRTLPKPSEFKDPNITDSIISTVTDFSPPKEWIDSEN